VLTALRQFGAPLLDLSEADLCAEDTVYQIGVPPSRIDILTGSRKSHSTTPGRSGWTLRSALSEWARSDDRISS
jgi:hypothetical protein